MVSQGSFRCLHSKISKIKLLKKLIEILKIFYISFSLPVENLDRIRCSLAISVIVMRIILFLSCETVSFRSANRCRLLSLNVKGPPTAGYSVFF